MRNDIDKAITEALDAEERDMMARYKEDPGLLAYATNNLFKGPMSGIMWMFAISQTVMFLLAVWIAWGFFHEDDPVLALRAGLTALFLFVIGALLKIAMEVYSEANRVIREVKRLELQVALLRERNAGQ